MKDVDVLVPDSNHLYSENELNGFHRDMEMTIDFQGPGWYLGETNSVLISLFRDGKEKLYRVDIWSLPNVPSLLGELANAPVRKDNR